MSSPHRHEVGEVAPAIVEVVPGSEMRYVMCEQVEDISVSQCGLGVLCRHEVEILALAGFLKELARQL